MIKTVIAGSNDNHCLDAIIGLAQDETVNFGDMFPKYGLVLLMQETSEKELQDLGGDLPTDTHLVTYRGTEGEVGADAVRSYSKADIFDAYHDSGLKVLSIQSGFGTIKPKLFNDTKKK